MKNEKTLNKIRNQIDGLNKKIGALSGEHKVNTYKRMREQEERSRKIYEYKSDIALMEYLIEAEENKGLSKFEEALISKTFRDEIRGLYFSYEQKLPVRYPQINESLPLDGWYNLEVPKRQKRLNKAGIYDSHSLNEALTSYEKIMEIIRVAPNPEQEKIQRMESKACLMQKGDINFTPSKVAEKLVSYARINASSRVLELSAGIGRIADEIQKVTNTVDVVEIVAEFRELLKLKGYNVVGQDFLEFTPDNLYDAIIMNPPFSDEQNHIRHAYEMIKPGGTLVAICSPHWTFANDQKSKRFREWVEQEVFWVEDLPSGTFDRTNVNSKILVIEKSHQEEEVA